MKRSIPHWQLAGFLFTAVAGTLLHFLFDWTRGNVVAALFSAVNESIWEHCKLLFYPMFLFAWIEHGVWGKQYRQFWCVKLAGTLLGLGLIPVVYYTYTGILGVNADWFNITIFFLAAAAAFRLETELLVKKHTCPIDRRICLAALWGLVLLFSLLTFYPPAIPFFRDPMTGTYGFFQGGSTS